MLLRTLTLAGFLLAQLQGSSIIGIWSDPNISVPPTSSTGYPNLWLGDAIYNLQSGQILNQVSIDGKSYLVVEGDDVPQLPTPPIPPAVLPPTILVPHYPEPVTHHHQPETPEPGTLACGALGILLLVGGRLRKRS